MLKMKRSPRKREPTVGSETFQMESQNQNKISNLFIEQKKTLKNHHYHNKSKGTTILHTYLYIYYIYSEKKIRIFLKYS